MLFGHRGRADTGIVQGLFLLAALLLPTASALGTPIFFNNRNQFDRALGPHDVIDFEDLPVGRVCSPLVSDPCTLRIGGATFSAVGPSQPQLSIQDDIGAPRSKALIQTNLPLAPGEFPINFAGHFIGLDVISLCEPQFPGCHNTEGDVGAPVSALLTEANGSQSALTLFANPGNGRFLGAMSEVGFSEVSLYALPVCSETFGCNLTIFTNFGIDNVALEPVPEPATLILSATTAACLGLAAWRRRSHA